MAKKRKSGSGIQYVQSDLNDPRKMVQVVGWKPPKKKRVAKKKPVDPQKAKTAHEKLVQRWGKELAGKRSAPERTLARAIVRKSASKLKKILKQK